MSNKLIVKQIKQLAEWPQQLVPDYVHINWSTFQLVLLLFEACKIS